ncbi:MAG: metallophosphoesterase [Rubrobacteraceae bacterium]
MRLKFLAISDAHLGEAPSVLTYQEGRRHLRDVILAHLGGGEKVETEQLVLMGDIPERSHATPDEMLSSTHGFMETLAEAVAFEKVVYTPGNHDHTLWTEYCKKLHGEKTVGCITVPEGESVVRGGGRKDENDSAGEILATIFEYPHGPIWEAIEENGVDISFANPLYAERFNGRTYVFSHGTHFRKEVTSPRWARRVAELLTSNGILGDFQVLSEGDVRDAKSLEELERVVAPFIDALLPAYENNPVSMLDEAGYLMAVLSGRFGLQRQSPDESRLFPLEDLPEVPEDRIPRLTAGGKIVDFPLKLCMEYFLPHMTAHLEEHGLSGDTTFVYGDTHDGGWGELSLADGRNLRVYNTGGWITYDIEDHPTCYLFAVDEAGTEYLLDVSYKEVDVNGNLLLKAVSDSSNTVRQKAGNALGDLLELVESARP